MGSPVRVSLLRSIGFAVLGWSVCAAPAAHAALWDVRLVGPGDERLSAMAHDSNRGVVFVGSAGARGLVASLRGDGTLRWSRSADVQLDCLTGTRDGALAIAGWRNDGAVLMRVTESGTAGWAMRVDRERAGEFTSIVETRNGDLVVTGVDRRRGALVLARFSPSGSLLWARRLFSVGWSYERGQQLVESADGDLLVLAGAFRLGQQSSSWSVLLRTQSAGEPRWARYWGGRDGDQKNRFAPLADGGALVAGSTHVAGSVRLIGPAFTEIGGDGATTASWGLLDDPDHTQSRLTLGDIVDSAIGEDGECLAVATASQGPGSAPFSFRLVRFASARSSVWERDVVLDEAELADRPHVTRIPGLDLPRAGSSPERAVHIAVGATVRQPDESGTDVMVQRLDLSARGPCRSGATAASNASDEQEPAHPLTVTSERFEVAVHPYRLVLRDYPLTRTLYCERAEDEDAPGRTARTDLSRIFRPCDSPPTSGGRCPLDLRDFLDRTPRRRPEWSARLIEDARAFLLSHDAPASQLVKRLGERLEAAPAGRRFTTRGRHALLRDWRAYPLAPADARAGSLPALRDRLVRALGELDLDLSAPWELSAKRDHARGDWRFAGLAKLSSPDGGRASGYRLQIRSRPSGPIAAERLGWPMAAYRIAPTARDARDPSRSPSSPDGAPYELELRYDAQWFDGSPERLRLLRWTGEGYEDVTWRVDAARGVVVGRARALGEFIVAMPETDERREAR